MRTILFLWRINDVLEQQFKHTNRQTQKKENSIEHHPPKEVGLRLHSIKAKTKSSRFLGRYSFKYIKENTILIYAQIEFKLSSKAMITYVSYS